jgi:predicted nucleic acid-binding protein
MAEVYLETSALLAWLLGEPQAAEAAAALDRADRVLTSVLTVTEAARGLLRAEQLGRLAVSERVQLLGGLEQIHPQWMQMEVSAEVRRRAAEPFPVEPVRTLDALHLATVLAFRRAYSTLTVLSFDQRIRDNVLAFGIATS